MSRGDCVYIESSDVMGTVLESPRQTPSGERVLVRVPARSVDPTAGLRETFERFYPVDLLCVIEEG